MTQENFEHRQGAVDGLTFVMLNLAADVDRSNAWALFHAIIDEYYDLCDSFHINY